MPRSLSEMASKGYTKATAKDSSIKASWAASKSRMQAGYDAMPFGATRKSNYRAAIAVATHYTDWEKWRRNWEAKMAE